MASIRTAVQIQDRMSQPLMGISNAMNIVISNFETMQRASSTAVNTASLQAARRELNSAEIAINGVEQEINQASQSQQKFNNQLTNSHGAANGLLDKMKGIAATAGLAFGAKQVLGLSDQVTSTTARLNLMNDNLQTTKELQDMIFASAQRSRSAYTDTAATVAKLGVLAKDSFSSNGEAIAFAEQMNKQFVIGGASISESTNAMYQLTQAMAAGKLQGDEFRSILENAPLLAQSIESYMGGIANYKDLSMKELSSEGLITADIIKNALFSVADETNAKFATMPVTFGQAWVGIQNNLLETFMPLIQVIGQGAQWINDNWSTIEPIFWGIAAAVGFLTVALIVQKIAVMALTTTLFGCPLLWIAIVIGILIMVIYDWVQSVGGIKIAWLIVVDRVLTALAALKIGFFIGVYFVLGLWDKLVYGINAAGTAIHNVIGDMKAGVLISLQGMVNGAIGIINDFISVLNKIPGVSIEAVQNVTFGTSAQLENEAAKSARNAALQDYRNEIDAAEVDRNNKIGDMANTALADMESRQADIEDAKAKATEKVDDNSTTYGTGAGATAANIADTANNTGKMADSLASSEEDLKYLRDLAEKDVINRISAPVIHLAMQNDLTVNTDMDLDGLVSSLATKIEDQMLISAEGA